MASTTSTEFTALSTRDATATDSTFVTPLRNGSADARRNPPRSACAFTSTVRGPRFGITSRTSVATARVYRASDKCPRFRSTYLRVTGISAAFRSSSVMMGMSANVTVVVRDEPAALLLPLDAVRGGTGNYRVLLRDKDGGAPREVPVEVGETTLYEVEVVHGLEAGDEVIVAGR